MARVESKGGNERLHTSHGGPSGILGIAGSDLVAHRHDNEQYAADEKEGSELRAIVAEKALAGAIKL